ncbi:MAG TPA: hypothetical protein VN702_17260 [Acetobacteraceae bacterium]|nr:hypothetical protein [Acetobacteraceae bacterium]
MSRAFVLFPMAILALTACSGGAEPSGQAKADAQTQAACRQRADEIYNQQNRAAIYAPQSSFNTPFSANYTPGVTDRGLADLYEHNRLVRDCVRNTGTGTERTQPPAEAAKP